MKLNSFFEKKVEAINNKAAADRERRQRFALEKLAEEVNQSHLRRSALPSVQNGTNDSTSKMDSQVLPKGT